MIGLKFNHVSKRGPGCRPSLCRANPLTIIYNCSPTDTRHNNNVIITSNRYRHVVKKIEHGWYNDNFDETCEQMNSYSQLEMFRSTQLVNLQHINSLSLILVALNILFSTGQGNGLAPITSRGTLIFRWNIISNLRVSLNKMHLSSANTVRIITAILSKSTCVLIGWQTHSFGLICWN